MNRRRPWAQVLPIVLSLTFVRPAHAERTAVLYFLNNVQPSHISASDVGFFQSDPQYDYLQRAFADMIMTDLARTHCVQLVERAKIEALADEIKFDATGAVTPETALHAGKALSSAYLIHGYISRDDGQLTIAPYLDYPPWSRDEMLPAVQGSEDNLLQLEALLLKRLRTRLCSTVPPSQAAAPVPHGATLAILPFNDNSKIPLDPALSQAFSDTAMAQLAPLGRFRLVERSRLNDLWKEIRLQNSGAVDERTALHAGHLLGAQYILFGSILNMGKTIRIDARISAVENTTTPFYWEVDGPARDIGDLAIRLVKQMELDLQTKGTR